VERGSELDRLLIDVERDLWVLMAEVATGAENRHKLVAEKTLVTAAMVERLEGLMDDVAGRFDPPHEFVVPGQSVVAAQLDVARTVVRRAERRALRAVADGSSVVPYLNRLSDYLWTLARWQEVESLPSRADPTKDAP
jgi:cob(I)alamin adenosyltransferase